MPCQIKQNIFADDTSPIVAIVKYPHNSYLLWGKNCSICPVKIGVWLCHYLFHFFIYFHSGKCSYFHHKLPFFACALQSQFCLGFFLLSYDKITQSHPRAADWIQKLVCHASITLILFLYVTPSQPCTSDGLGGVDIHPSTKCFLPFFQCKHAVLLHFLLLSFVSIKVANHFSVPLLVPINLPLQGIKWFLILYSLCLQ